MNDVFPGAMVPMKYISLFLLMMQNAVLIIVMRYARTREGDMFKSTTAVIMQELCKTLTALAVIFYEVNRNFSLQPKMFIPSISLFIVRLWTAWISTVINQIPISIHDGFVDICHGHCCLKNSNFICALCRLLTESYKMGACITHLQRKMIY